MPNSYAGVHRPGSQSVGLVAVDGSTFPLRAARIRARALGGLAATTLIQEYENRHAEPIEVLYTMPLPADGAIAGYTFRIGERVVKGEIETREEAQEDYRRALLEGRTAGLLEQERADTFSQSLGNVPPGVPVTVEIEVLHPLLFLPAAADSAAQWEWRFPTVVGVRYEGREGRVPDADRLDAPRADREGTPVRITAELTIGDGEVRVAEPSRLDRDLVFIWNATTAEVDARLVEGGGLPGDDGRYALLTITPPAVPFARLARDLTVLIDASGSMHGRPLEVAKEVVSELLDSLHDGDRFQLLAFSTGVGELTKGSVAAGPEAVRTARARLAELAASGGTEMVSALREALSPLRAEAQRQVVLLTDGYVGFEAEVVRETLTGLPEGSRLHVVGIGAAPNRALTRAAARAGRGLELLIGLGDDPRVAAARLARGTAAPVLTEVRVRGGAVRGVAPERPRDVFAGDPLVVLLELAPHGGVVEVEARRAGSSEPWVLRLETPSSAAPPAVALPLGAFYGRELVEDLEALGVHDSDIRVEAAGLRHRIVTRRTSLVAISQDPTVDPRDPRRRLRLPVEMPYGVSAEGVGLAGGRISPFDQVLLARDKMSAILDKSLSMTPLAEAIGRAHDVIQGRLIRFEGSVILFEFEVPEGGMTLPEDGDRCVVGGSSVLPCPGLFDAALGTKPGAYAAGLTVRLAVTLPLAPWPAWRPMTIVWTGGDRRRHEVRLS